MLHDKQGIGPKGSSDRSLAVGNDRSTTNYILKCRCRFTTHSSIAFILLRKSKARLKENRLGEVSRKVVRTQVHWNISCKIYEHL